MKKPNEEIADKFQLMIERFPRADGEPWSGAEMQRATDGQVTSSYFSGLRKGKWKQPGIRHLSLIADVMGFPFELWRLDPEYWEEEIRRHSKYNDARNNYQREPGEEAERDPFVAAFRLYEEDISMSSTATLPNGEDLANLLNILFDSKTDPRTGQPYTINRVSRLSRGRVEPEEIARMRAGGQTEKPAEIKLIALSQVFGIPMSYWYVSNEQQPVIDLDDLEHALANLFSDERVIVIRSGQETDEVAHGEGSLAVLDSDEKSRHDQNTRRIVAAMLNKLANTELPASRPYEDSLRGRRRVAAS